MKIPLIVRIGALVLATTGFYTYVGQMVPQKEVQPPQETVLESRPDHGRHGQGRPRDHGGQGTLPDLPHDRQDAGRSGSPTSRASMSARRPASRA